MRCVQPARTGFVRVLTLCAAVLASGCADQNLGSLYSDLAANLEAQGHLRTDIRPADAPYSAADLATNFQRIAFSYEFHFRDGRLVNEPIDKPLKRWQGKVRYRLMGDAVTPEDYADVAALTARLEPLTGLDFERTEGHADMLITIATRKGRRQISRHLRAVGQGAYATRYDLWRRSPGWICGATMSVSRNEPFRLVHAHVFIGSEVQGLMRTSCLHEEIVQALGLTNDHAGARPSIFNDDQEFALMTAHDAALLRALYDPRLRPGMSAAEAMPIARGLFAALAPGQDTDGQARIAKSR